MELAGADDKDGKPDSGELSGESESNAATIFCRTTNLQLQARPCIMSRNDACCRAELRRRIPKIIMPRTNMLWYEEQT
jgi:hypothetical protein